MYVSQLVNVGELVLAHSVYPLVAFGIEIAGKVVRKKQIRNRLGILHLRIEQSLHIVEAYRELTPFDTNLLYQLHHTSLVAY